MITYLRGEKMANSKKLIIAMLLVVILIIVIIVGLLIYQNRGKVFHGIEESGTDVKVEINDILKRVDNKTDFYAVKSCIDKYYLYLTNQNAKTEIIYNMLDKEYIIAKQITKDNMMSNLPKFDENQEVTITDMYVNDKTNEISIYIADGILRGRNTLNTSKFKIIVKLDKLNRTFGILPQDYVQEKYGKAELNTSLQIEVPKEIEKNNDNLYDLRNITEESYVQDLFNRYKNELRYSEELAYQELDEEYSKIKFGSFTKFQEYIKNNYKEIVIGKLDKYQKTFENGYTRYVFIDTKGRNYIFKETAPMKYTVIMDTYTVDIPEFLERYNNGTEQEKVILNLNKFMLALNDGDYKYAYNVLADSFKTNNFKSQQDFENYAKSNFFTNNKFDYTKFGNDTSTYYTYDITISDADGKDMNTKTKKFIMVLGSGTDFEISFNV